ncbi:MAG: polysaccharide deacetylase family protein, partial [Acidimicrobiales bacterium]
MKTARQMVGLGAGMIGAGAALHLLPGAVAWRQLRCRLTPVLAGVGDPGHVALTFDDGPDRTSTPEFLDVLDALGWKATFFLLGSQVSRDPGLAAEVAARGHDVGVHGDRHTNHLRATLPTVLGDLRQGRRRVEDATGRAVHWVRPPYGAVSAASLVAARRLGLQTVLWTSWGRDWRAVATPVTVAADVSATWWPGATVLLHDSDITSAPGSWRATLGALP